MGENFKLKWNDHHSIFFSTAESLCQGDHLTDVTLSCGKKEFSAHKLVLSICSQYFYELFKPKQNRPANQAAIVYLKDVSPSHMELLLNFMYRGEINVEEEELMTLLNTARGLQIRGLSDNTNEDTSNNIQSENQYTKPKPKAVKRAKSPIVTPSTSRQASSAASTSGSASNSPAKKIKPDPETAEHLESYEDIPDDSADPDYDDNVYIEGNEEDYNDQSGQGGPMIFEGEMPPPEVVMAEKQMDFKRYICSTCFKGFNSPSDLQRHERIHTGVMPYVCEYCKKGFKQKNSLKRHYLVHTGEKPYECSVCFQRFQEKAKMKYHMAMKHSEVAQQQQLAEQLQQLQAHAQNLQQFQSPIIPPEFVSTSALPKLPPPPGPHD